MKAKKRLVVSKTQVKKPTKVIKALAPRKNIQKNVPNAVQPNTSPKTLVKTMKEVKPKITKSTPIKGDSLAKSTANEDQYNRKYEFNAKASARSPVSKYEVERVKAEEKNSGPFGEYYSAKEANFIKGTAHSFGHSGSQVQGKLRTSGHASAHRIGKK